jgi:class 3 adenylate cyclase
MSRMRAREAVVVVVTLTVWFATYSVLVLDKPFAPVGRGLANLTILIVFITAANYMIEGSARRDFILMRLLGEEREKSERLLLNVLPAPVAERLKESPGTVADSFEEVTVLFADIADSTPNVARLTAEEAVEFLNEIFTAFDELADEHGLEKIKTIGDGYMVVGGLPEPRPDHAAAVVALAVDMQEQIGRFRWPTGEPVVLRIGINTGPVVAGVIGRRKFSYDLWGDTVHVASRMESHGVAGSIQLAQSTHERVRAIHRGTKRIVDVKGKGPMPVYVLHARPFRHRRKTKARADRPRTTTRSKTPPKSTRVAAARDV